MSLAKKQKTDVFPCGVAPFTQRHVLPRRPDFRSISASHEANLIAFVIALENKTIYYYPLELRTSVLKHFRDTAKFLNEEAYVATKWDSVGNRIRRSVDNLKKNTDCRTCFKFNQNCFLTKSSFTFGLRTVQAGTHHVYQMGPVPMAFYVPSLVKKTTLREKAFVPDEQFYYDAVRLEAGKNYRVPEGTRYVVCTMVRTFFAVHVVPADARLPFETLDPVPEKKKKRRFYASSSSSASSLLKRDPYKFPVRTPMIEQIALEESGSEDDEPVEAPREPFSLMPPPPPRPAAAEQQQQQQHETTPCAVDSVQIVKNYFHAQFPTEKVIQITHPDMVEWFRRVFRKTRYDCAAIPTDFVPYACDPELDVVLDLSVAAPKDQPEPKQFPQQQQQEVEVLTTMDSSPSRIISEQQQQPSSPFAPAPTTCLVQQQQQQPSSPFAPAPTTCLVQQQQQQQPSFKKVPEAVVRPSSILPTWTTPTAFCVQPRQQQYHPLSPFAATPQPMILSEGSYPVRLHQQQQQQQQQSGSELETFFNPFQTLTDTFFQTNFLSEPLTMNNQSDSFQWGQQQQQQQPFLDPAGNDNTNDIVTSRNLSSLDESIQRLLFEM